MATILDKDLVRESTLTVEDRNILVTITADQKISMKLKGMKSGTVSISIADLYAQLTSNSAATLLETPSKSKKNTSDTISLHDLRHRCMIKGFDYATTVKFDSVLHELIEENEKK